MAHDYCGTLFGMIILINQAKGNEKKKAENPCLVISRTKERSNKIQISECFQNSTLPNLRPLENCTC